MARSLFWTLDQIRRAQGLLSDALGAGPREQRWTGAAAFPGARLRRYGGRGPPLLILPAPFKRPYIWDLLPDVSVVRAALRRGFRVYLLEWLPPAGDGGAGSGGAVDGGAGSGGAGSGGRGLADFALALPEAAAEAIAREAGPAPLALAGHSLGGTLAAIFAALRPELVGRLALVDAPLAFAADGGPLAAAVAASPPTEGAAAAFGEAVPGSVINAASARAAPEAFLHQPAADALACAASPGRMAVHLRVRRWTLDEVPMPARLFDEIAEDLYRGDRFRTGGLTVGAETARLSDLRVPVAAVLNAPGLIVPPRSVLAGLRAAGLRPELVLRYRAEPGPAIQHLGPLVGPGAHRLIWPRLLDWLAAPL